MLISFVKGGLGNQLFIYYFTQNVISVSKHKRAYFDLNFYFPKMFGSYSTICIDYNIRFILTRFFQIKKVKPVISKVLIKLGKLNRKLNLFFLPTLIDEENFSYELINKRLIVLLVGHWINRDYYKTNITLPKLIKTNKKFNEILEMIETTNSVSIHIRGGQYVNDKGISKTYAVITENYYKNALNDLESKINKPTYFIFTNDLPYAKKIIEELHLKNINIVTGLEDYEDFYLMTKCKHNIIINSTFSWWAGFLNENSTKIVIAPEHWSGEKEKNRYYNSLPFNNWIKQKNS